MSNGKTDSNRSGSPKKSWSQPQVIKLLPGAAETGPANNIVDGTGTGDNKS